VWKELIPVRVRGKMIKTTEIKDRCRATIKSNLQKSAIDRRKAIKNNITIEKIRKK
jgi:hypothetical protein